MINMQQVKENNEVRKISPTEGVYVNSVSERKALMNNIAKKKKKFEPIDRRDLALNRHDQESDLQIDVAENEFDEAFN